MSERTRGATDEDDEQIVLDVAGIEEALGSGHVGPGFGGQDVSPLERQRRAHQFLTQETRYYALLALLGHPHHLASLDELEYLVPKNRSTVHDALTRLQKQGIVDQYEIEGNAQDEPGEFWGLTEYGVELLYDFNMLRYVPVLRVVQDHLYLTDKVQRHREANRPALPEGVREAFDADDAPEMGQELHPANQEAIMESAQLFDAPPIELDPGQETAEGADRPLDELF